MQDKVLGKVNHYDDHLANARGAGYESLADMIVALHGEHKGSAGKVAAELKVCRDTPLKWFRRIGLPTIRGPLEYTHPRRKEVGDLYSETKSVAKVGSELGVRPSTVCKWLEQDGIPRRKARG
jgi:hypothetical protein